MKRKSEAEQAPEFRVEQKVQLDKQPFVWTVLEVGVEGFRNRVKIRTFDPHAIVQTITRTVDVIRLTPLTDEQAASFRKLLTPLEKQ